jgi:hypothetical protein
VQPATKKAQLAAAATAGVRVAAAGGLHRPPPATAILLHFPNFFLCSVTSDEFLDHFYRFFSVATCN